MSDRNAIQRAKRAYWRKEGLCPQCGSVAEPGRKHCSYHLLMFMNAYDKRKGGGA